MKKFIVAGVVSLLVMAGVAVAQQSQNQNNSSSVHDMMHGMMENQGGPDGGMGHMGGMMNMMHMMAQMDQEQMGKMMEQCNAMMESARTDGGGAKESQKQ
jgi:hypothetical protein